VLTFPPALRPGDVIAVAAPSGPLPLADLWRGLAWVRARYRVKLLSSALGRAGYLAGDDTRRRAELARWIADPDVKAIVAGRGGYGATRVLEGLDLAPLAHAPRWIVGFSDITALHLAAGVARVASIHGPNVTGLGRASPADRAAWLAALERPGSAADWSGLTVVHAGTSRARGPTFGGNLALLEATAAAGRLVVPPGATLMIEDVDEKPYRVDRMLTALRAGGHLARAAAVVFGGFTRCTPGPDGVSVEEVLRDRTADLGVPVVADAPFGHGEVNRAFVLGRMAEVDTSVGAVTFAAM
jgi:muramoyltetrapeptide carboxypeptidase